MRQLPHPRRWTIAIVLLTVLASIAAAWFFRGPRLPAKIQHALKMMPSIPTGSDVETAFRTLGFELPYDAVDKYLGGSSTMNWARYDIGFGDDYVLEVESHARDDKDFTKSDMLDAAEIRRKIRVERGQPVYESMLPRWSSPHPSPAGK
jgi:hypothetical protein